VRTVEGVRLVEGRNQRSWKFDDEEILKKFDGVKIPKKYQHTLKVLSPAPTAINISLISGAAFLRATKSASLISGVSSFVTRIESTNTVSRVVFIPDSALSAINTH
jgi:energy-converting hydrogenase Eha subunit G